MHVLEDAATVAVTFACLIAGIGLLLACFFVFRGF
jgi:hypothetical protein